jgi:aryl-alcohol dehydrogenase-like predicted oxidoreductase
MQKGIAAMETELVPLGKSGVMIPPMGIGTWSWGDSFFWGYGDDYAETEIRDAFLACMNTGLHFFDTAEVYGLGSSESFLGNFLKADGRKAILATKFFPFPHRFSPGRLLHALRGSLRRLKVPQVDLYQIHQPFSVMSIPTLMGAMAEAHRLGLIRAAGVSNYSLEQTKAAADALALHGLPLASNQISYSLIQRSPERSGLLSLCRDLGVAVIAYSPLGMGMLSGRYSPNNPPPGFRSRRFNKAFLSRLQPLLMLMEEIGKGHGGKTNIQIALNWVMRKGAIPIPGVKNEFQAHDVFGALGWRLSSEEVIALDKASEELHR